MDHNVVGAITTGLRARGVDCLTAREDGADTVADELVFQRAVDLDRVVFTEDVDFFAIASHWIKEGRPFPGLVFGAQMGITIGQALFDLELVAEVFQSEEMRSQIIWLPI
jgi:hypothetical protein